MRKVLIVSGSVLVAIVAAIVAGWLPGDRGIPLNHEWRQTKVCEQYARKSAGTFTSGTLAPIAAKTFFSERLGTCVQALTFSPNDYSVIDLTNGFSNNQWLFICSPQGLYVTDFSSGKGRWLEEGPRPGRPCERLFKQTLAEIR